MSFKDPIRSGRRARCSRRVWILLLVSCAAAVAVTAQQPPADLPAAAPTEAATPLLELSFFQVLLWQWIGLGVLIGAAALVAWIAVEVVAMSIRPLVARTRTQLDDRLIRIMIPPARLLLWLALVVAGSLLLRLAAPAHEFLGNVARTLVILGLTWFGVRVVDVGAALMRQRLEARERWTAVAVLPLGSRAAKVALCAVALVASLQNLGVDVTGLIAGLSIGGLAIGLAAQKSIANLFGGVSLAVDQPVRVGDLCRFGNGKSGTVEEIGLRSTRVRTDDRTLVTVPNAEFSEMQLENLAARDKIRLSCIIGLRYETRPDQLRHVLAEMRRLLLSHPMVDDPARVRFVGFGPHSLDLEVFAYVKSRDAEEFLEVREDVYLRFMEIVAASGTAFALPAQTIYLGRDGGLDGERSRQAEEQVRAWREAGELPFPEFTGAAKARMRGTADWPPCGSAK